MKAHYLNSKEKATAKAVAADLLEVTSKRVQYLWILSMYNCGLSPRTINRVAAEMISVCDKYHDYKIEGIADEAVKRDLARIGLEA